MCRCTSIDAKNNNNRWTWTCRTSTCNKLESLATAIVHTLIVHHPQRRPVSATLLQFSEHSCLCFGSCVCLRSGHREQRWFQRSWVRRMAAWLSAPTRCPSLGDRASTLLQTRITPAMSGWDLRHHWLHPLLIAGKLIDRMKYSQEQIPAP